MSSKSVPELLDESTGSPTRTFKRRSIAFNKLTRRPLGTLSPASNLSSPPQNSASPLRNFTSTPNSSPTKVLSIADSPRITFVKGENLKTVGTQNSEVGTSDNSPEMKNSEETDARDLLSILGSPGTKDSTWNTSNSEKTQNQSKSDKTQNSSKSSEVSSSSKHPHKKHKSSSSKERSESSKDRSDSSRDRSESSRDRSESSKDRSESSKDRSSSSKKRSHSADKPRSSEPPKKLKKSEDSLKSRDHSSGSCSSDSRSRHKKSSEHSKTHSQDRTRDKRKSSDSRHDDERKRTTIGNFKKRRVSRVAGESDDAETELKNSKRKSKNSEKELCQLFGKEEEPKAKTVRVAEDGTSGKETQPKGTPGPGTLAKETPGTGTLAKETSGTGTLGKGTTGTVTPRVPPVPSAPQVPPATQNTPEPPWNPTEDEGLDPNVELERIRLEAGQSKPPTKKTTAGSGHYLTCRLKRGEKEKEKKQAFAEAPKPASAFRPRNRVPRPPRPVLPVPTTADATESHAQIDHDDKMFEEIEDTPAPLIALVEKAFEPQPKPRGIPLIGEASSQGSEPMELDEEPPSTPDSDATVIIEYQNSVPSSEQSSKQGSSQSSKQGSSQSSKQSSTQKSNQSSTQCSSQSSARSSNQSSTQPLLPSSIPSSVQSSSNLVKISYNTDGLETIKTVDMSPGTVVPVVPTDRSRTPSVLEKIMNQHLEPAAVERTLNELSKLPQNSGTQVPRRNGSPGFLGNSTIFPRITSLVGGKNGVPVKTESRSIPIKDKSRDMMYQEMVDILKLFRHRSYLKNLQPQNLTVNRHLVETLLTVRVRFQMLRARMQVEEEPMIELLAAYGRRVNVEPFLGAEEISYAIRTPVERPVPVPVPGVEGRNKGKENNRSEARASSSNNAGMFQFN